MARLLKVGVGTFALALLVSGVVFYFLPPANDQIWACGERTGNDILPNGAGATYTGGPITLDMNKLPPYDKRMPRGGRYVETQAVSNLYGAQSDVLRVRMFDAACDSIVINGQPLHPDNIPAKMEVFDVDGTMVLRIGEDGAVVLRGIPFEYWSAGARAQKFGTAGRDEMLGTANSEVFTPGGGSDTVAPSGGNDRINFAFNDLTILSEPPNLGIDTLDLRRFSRADIVIAAEGDDAVISTPDGTIRLTDQYLSLSGGNIERVLLADEDALDTSDIQELSSLQNAN